ncbi:hypothetical protein ABZU86_18745 [Streptomyces sp. NPDC005271]|uniref:hypothetical protein n=1 Tax=unclassified Streptomyces TaxID=2593676 RepID=UPI0033A56EB2
MAVVVAGALLAVLALGGVTWTLLNDDGSGGKGATTSGGRPDDDSGKAGGTTSRSTGYVPDRAPHRTDVPCGRRP